MWVPVVEQTTWTGVLALTVPRADPQVLAQAGRLGVFAGLVVAATARVSDVPYLRRRGRAMSLPAGMQWDLLLPLSARTAGALIAGALEPAYDQPIRTLARTVTPATVRSLDAIHLGTALRSRPSLTSFVTYDKRLLDAAQAAGLPTDSPA